MVLIDNQTFLLLIILIHPPTPDPLSAPLVSHLNSLKQPLLSDLPLHQFHQALGQSIPLLPLYEKTQKLGGVLLDVLQSLYGAGRVAYFDLQCQGV